MVSQGTLCLFVPCIVIQLCHVNQQIALFKLCFNSILLVFYMFRTSYVHHQEDYIVHAALYGIFSMHLFKQSTSTSFNLVYCLHKCMENIPYKAACTI